VELSPKQQINELVKKSQSILILSHKNLSGDSLGGMLALERVLTKQGKEVALVSTNEIGETLSFLPGIEKVKADINGTRDLIVQLDKSKFPIEKLSYNEEDGILSIIITPEKGLIEPNEVKVLQGEYKFDLIFVLDTPDIDKIDSVYDKHTDLFFETPIINVDHHTGNEYYGTVNFVDLTATSTCEILVSIIESMGANHFDPDVATCLLTGIIADTGSFKNINTTPKSLTISAQMLAAGARQQEIIQNLYKTRPFNTLKLWGKILSRLEHDKDNKFVYSYVNNADFAETGAKLEDISNLMEELLTSTPGADVVLVLSEFEPRKIAGKLRAANGHDVLAIAELFSGTGKVQAAGFNLFNQDLEKAIPEVVAKIQDFRAVQMGRKKPEEKKEIQQEIPKAKEAPKAMPHNHLPKAEPKELAEETKKLDKKIEEASKIIEPSEEIKELFEKFISQPSEEVKNTEPIEEPKDTPVVDPIMQALESLEHEEKIGAQAPEESSQTIEEILDAQETEEVDDSPAIDISEIQTKEDTLKAIGDIIRGYKPGQGLDDRNQK
jgi:phosphoesterase RecJ-like protein